MTVSPGNGRWLILTQYYPPEIGAPQIRLRAMAAELQRRGIEVEVLTGMPNYPSGVVQDDYKRRWRARDVIDGVPVRRTWLYAATGKSARARLANYFSFTATALVSLLTGPRPAILFVESQPLSLGICALSMKWLRGVPYIYNVPDLQIDIAKQLGFMQDRRVLAVARWLEDRFLRESWKVSTVTERFIEHFCARGMPRRQITFLPNGADTAFLRPMAPDPAYLTRWRLHGKKVFAYVGTVAFYHGLETLIEAATVLRHDTELVVLIVGDGPERPRLEAMATARDLTNVIFARNRYEEMAAIYSVAYASVATLRDVPVAAQMRLAKVFPSLSCGVPVVYAGRGEAADLIAGAACGIVVAPEDPVKLAEAIRSLAADPSRRQSMSRNGRALVERDYSWSTIIDRWLVDLQLPSSVLDVMPRIAPADL